jgi:hypothetical protein
MPRRFRLLPLLSTLSISSNPPHPRIVAIADLIAVPRLVARTSHGRGPRTAAHARRQSVATMRDRVVAVVSVQGAVARAAPGSNCSQ